VHFTTSYTLSAGLVYTDIPVSAPKDATIDDVTLGVLLAVLSPSTLPTIFLLLPNGGVSDTKKFFIGFDCASLVVEFSVFLLLPNGGVNDDRNPLDPWLL